MGLGASKTVAVWHALVYASATLTIDGNSGLTAMPAPMGAPGVVFYPLSFELEGQNIATDETLTLVVNFYPTNDAAWNLVTPITFAAATAGSPKPPLERFPGDITVTGLSGQVPCPPFFLATWTLAGTTKSMNFNLYASGVLVQ